MPRPASHRSRSAPRPRTAALLLVAAALVCAPGCAGDGTAARARQEHMISGAGIEGAKLVVLEVRESRGRLTVGEDALEALRRSSLVLDAKRGAGTNEAYAAIPPEGNPDTLVLLLESKGFTARVLQVLTKADFAQKL